MASILVPAAAATAPPPRARPTFSLENLRERQSEKIVFTFFGDKDGGKTREMVGVGAEQGARHLALSFDQKTKGVKVGAFANNRRIWVVDAVQFYADAQPEEITWSASVTVDFLDYTLDTLGTKFRPHFVDFDGTEVMEAIAEMKMRYLHGLKPSEGFAERAWWKDRRMVLRALHRKAASIGEVGVCYTAYPEKNPQSGGGATSYETPVGEGSLHAKDRVPRWIDVMMQETDVAVECLCFYNSTLRTKTFERYVLAAKPHLADIVEIGKRFDVTGKSIPWGPGLARRIAAVDERLKGVEIVYPEESTIAAEQRNVLPPAPVVAPEAPIAAAPVVAAASSDPAPPKKEGWGF